MSHYEIGEVTVRKRGYQRRQSNRGQTIISICPNGETILENLENRRRRPIKEWKAKVLPLVFEKLNLPKDTKVAFRQKAGCDCGCSPGWIVQGSLPGELYNCWISTSVEMVG